MSNLDKGLKRARAALHSVGAEAATAPALEPAVGRAPDAPFDVHGLPWVEPDLELLEQNRIVVDELSTARASYKVLRTRVLQRMRRNGWRTLAVTGTCPGEGKSLTAINLGIHLAWHVTTSVVLVDLDLRSPTIHRYFGIEPRYDLFDHLHGGVPLERVAIRPGIDRLGVIMNNQRIANSSELLASPEVAAFVEHIKAGEERIVVFDLPPVLAGDDMLAFAPLVDAVLLVVAEGRTTRSDLAAAHELLQNVNVVGTVLNRSSEDFSPYYYGQR
jgi:Mrp family chromosome partitioning ATPase